MVTSKSRSPTVSLPRRNEPAGVTLSTAFPTLLICSAISLAAASAALIRNRPGRFLEDFHGLENILFAFFAESRQIAQFPSLRDFLDVRDGGGT